MGGGQKGTPIGLSFATSTNLGFSPKNIWLLVLLLLSHWGKISRPLIVPVPNYWIWTKTNSQKIGVFLLNLYNIEVMITSLIEMLELSNFGHMTTCTVQFSSHKKVLLVMSYTGNMTS